ncbi:hypothetical protein LC653_40450 [Nostoc sp. CHAB 5784]|uniref:hypothetical protein n=1 Tax=Nostoc mirabile TaxID=2907820 RepID=UPI001E45527D|nr:hypothetical protein [Nostoc mirabile]MCC5669913.1 hypothetical protein [Nostoc mirabile CHAB5784]
MCVHRSDEEGGTAQTLNFSVTQQRERKCWVTLREAPSGLRSSTQPTLELYSVMRSQYRDWALPKAIAD